MANDPTTTPPEPGGHPDGDLGARVGKIETEQREQRGILEQVLAAVKPGGGGGQAPAPAGSPAPGTVNIGAIQQQVRQEIEAADRRRAAEAAEKGWREEVTAVVETVKREKTPREPETGPRAFVQRLLIGRPQS